METGNIIHEQIKIKDAKEACVKVGAVVGRNSCKWALDVVIDGEIYVDLEICYHCQLEKEFTPEKAFDIFDYGVSVFVLCNLKEDGSIERKVIGLVPSHNDPYPKLCGLKRFFAKVQQIGSDGYPMWEDQIDPLIPPKPICKYFWIFFDDDGGVRTEEVQNHSFMSNEELINLLEDISGLFNQFADGSISLIGLADAIYNLMDKHADATAILDRVTDIPEGSDSVFTKAFMMYVGKCEQRYVAEQHLLMKDRQIKFDQGTSFPITNCTYIDFSPPNRFYCNVGTGDMVWSHIIQEGCPIFLGLTLHVNLNDGSIGDSHTFDCNGYIDYFNPSENYDVSVYGYQEVQIDLANISDVSFDLIPEITNIDGTVISGYMNFWGRPQEFTFDVVNAESHAYMEVGIQDAEHILWTEKGFEAVSSWHFEQELNPIETGSFEKTYHDDDAYGPDDYYAIDAWFDDTCHGYSADPEDDCTGCHGKCHHAITVGHDVGWNGSQGANGKSVVSFTALGKEGSILDQWNSSNDANSHTTHFYECICPRWSTGWYPDAVWHSSCRMQDDSPSYRFWGVRNSNRNYNYRESQSYKMAWVSNNITYTKNRVNRTYNNRTLHFDSYAPWQGTIDDYRAGHCGGSSIDDFDRWTLLSNCLQIAASAPDFMGPFLDLDGWPDWSEGYTENIWYEGDPNYYWHCNRTIDLNDIQEPYVREFDMGDGITFSTTIYEIPYYLDDRSTDPSAGLVVAAKGYQDYSNAAGSSHWEIYHDSIDVTAKVLDALKCDPALLVTLGMV